MKHSFNLATLLVAVVTLLVMASCSEKKKAEVAPASAPAPKAQAAPEPPKEEEKPLYTWSCQYCGEQTVSMDSPGGLCNVEKEPGFRPNHKWQRLGRVR